MTLPGGGEPSDAEVEARFSELVDRFYEPASGDGRPRHPGAVPPPVVGPPGLDWLFGTPWFDDPPPRSARDAWNTGFDDLAVDPGADPDFDDLEPLGSDPLDAGDPGPLPRLSNPALAGVLLLAGSVTVCLLSLLGLPFPAWGRGLAVLGLVAGVALLLARLPGHVSSPLDDDLPDDPPDGPRSDGT